MKRIIGIGAAAGAVGGLAAFGYARLQVAPLIASAIEYEEARSHALADITGEHAHEHEVFTRAVQENLGAGVGVVGFGIVVGVLFAVAYCVLSAALTKRGVWFESPWAATAASATAFVCVSLVPFLVYPANPPGVGQPDTAGQRTMAYLALLVVSVAAAAVVITVALRWAPRIGGWASGISAAWAYVIVIAIAVAILPGVHEVPDAVVDEAGALVFPGFPAELLAEFRLQSLLTSALMWMVLGTAFATALARGASSRSTTPFFGVAHADR